MKRMSFMLTVKAMEDGTKDVTRRLGWADLKPGDQFMAVEQCQGLRKGGLKKNGEKPKVFGPCECVSNKPEPLHEIKSRPCRLRPAGDVMDRPECEREGFPHLRPDQFIAMFCQHMKVEPSKVVNRIQFKRVNLRIQQFPKGGQ